jgi:CrcB protein
VIDARVIAAVGLGAALGGIARLLITHLVTARAGALNSFYATALINVSGSFLIGAVIEIAQTRANVSPLWRYFLATGILGGYTTFSTFSLEALSMLTRGYVLNSLFYVVGSVVLGVAAAFGGVAAARAVVP